MAAAPDLDIVSAKNSDSGDFAAHIARHLAESGAYGSSHFAPVSVVSRDEVAHESERRWSTPLTQPGWGRVWMLTRRDRPSAWPLEAGARVTGHVELRGALLHSGLHRADLSIGIEQGFRSAGFGIRLAHTALSFAYETGRIEYIDLRVFSHNEPARKLYRRLGFAEVGRVDDAFRMTDGTKIDDVMMVLRLR
ncbi:MAG: GNAT family N-acetyltransferase [Polyangiaceae bacterium]|nr:GNAT family N-acetyltransferase [Polyangiaceae bacterium]